MSVSVKTGAGSLDVFDLQLKDVLVLDSNAMLGILLGRRMFEQLCITVDYSTGQCVLGSKERPVAQWKWHVDPQTELYYLSFASSPSSQQTANTQSKPRCAPLNQFAVPTKNRYNALSSWQQTPNGRA